MPVGVCKAVFKVGSLLGGGSLARSRQNPELPLKECSSCQVGWGRWAPPAKVLPLCNQRHTFLGVEWALTKRSHLFTQWGSLCLGGGRSRCQPAMLVPENARYLAAGLTRAFGSRKAFLNTLGIYTVQRARRWVWGRARSTKELAVVCFPASQPVRARSWFLHAPKNDVGNDV